MTGLRERRRGEEEKRGREKGKREEAARRGKRSVSYKQSLTVLCRCITAYASSLVDSLVTAVVQVVRMMDRCCFFLSVNTMMVAFYLILVHPEYLAHFYTLCCCGLFPMRCESPLHDSIVLYDGLSMRCDDSQTQCAAYLDCPVLTMDASQRQRVP